ncbi:MAG: peptide deformylase [Solirubrobacteraceae bacterium]
MPQRPSASESSRSSPLREVPGRQRALAGLDSHGATVDREMLGFPAVVAQHETDHLNGGIFLDRMTGMTSLMTFEECQRRIASSPTPKTEGR